MRKIKVLELWKHAIPRRILLNDALKYKKSGSVLDVGAGVGRNSVYLAKKGFNVTATDIYKKSILELRENARKANVKIKTRIENVVSIKDKHEYDIVICTMVLHFLKKSQVLKAVGNLKKHTKLGGINVITTYTNKNTAGLRPYLFRKGELKRYYSDWKILRYNEKLGSRYRLVSGGEILRNYRALLIAQKI